MDIDTMLREMKEIYSTNPSAAVRGSTFIKMLHAQLSADLTARLTPYSVNRRIHVVLEANLFGSHKSKNVDVCVIDPENGPIMTIGIRSQMSSIGKNVLTYYEEIIGDCISLQDRFPMSVYGYVYLMPLHPIKPGLENESVNHKRYARFYDAVTGREGQAYASIRGVYDQWAYSVVDFSVEPPALRDDLVTDGTVHDMRISTFVDRMVNTFKKRHIFLDSIFS